MRILQINASYKPAYVYGGPTMSVAKLCEVLLKTQDSRHKTQDIESRALEKMKLKVGGFDSAQPDIGFDSPDEKSGPAAQPDIGFDSPDEKSGQAAQNDSSTLPMKNRDQLLRMTNVEVYTTLANGKEELPYQNRELRVVDGVLVRYFKRLTKDHSHFSPALLIYLWKTVKNFDVVHVHAWWNLVSVLSCWIAICRGVPVLLTPRGTLSPYSFSQNQSFMKRCFHFLFGKPLFPSLHFHLTSSKELKDTQQLTRGKSFQVIPNFVQLSEPISDHVSFEGGPLSLLFLSRIEQKKGLELLFDSLAELNISFHLNIVGSGEEDYINSLRLKVDSLKLAHKVAWLGPVYGDEKFKLMAQHHLLVLPSYDENFANVVIESLSVGTPVLMSEGVGLADYIVEKDLGWVCKRDVGEFSRKITWLHDKRKLLSAISERSSRQILIDFEENELRNQYLELYQQLIHESI